MGMIVVEFEKTSNTVFKMSDIITIATLEIFDNGRQNIMILFKDGHRYFANNVKWRFENDEPYN